MNSPSGRVSVGQVLRPFAVGMSLKVLVGSVSADRDDTDRRQLARPRFLSQCPAHPASSPSLSSTSATYAWYLGFLPSNNIICCRLSAANLPAQQ